MYKDFIVITNRSLAKRGYPEQIEYAAALHPEALILREKELSDEAYLELSKEVSAICAHYGVCFYIHQRVLTARKLGIRNIHLSIAALDELTVDDRSYFEKISVSCHSKEDLLKAVYKGATQIVLGTIFETDCKKGLKGKGLEFVKEITGMSPIPVYAIGGIKESNIEAVKAAGAKGGCMMSGFMEM